MSYLDVLGHVVITSLALALILAAGTGVAALIRLTCRWWRQ